MEWICHISLFTSNKKFFIRNDWQMKCWVNQTLRELEHVNIINLKKSHNVIISVTYDAAKSLMS